MTTKTISDKPGSEPAGKDCRNAAAPALGLTA